VVRNARALAAGLLERGFRLVSGGTDNHLMVIDMTSKKAFGKKMAQAMDKAGLVANYNTIPYDPRRPFSPSGVRLGTPCVTSRGMGEGEMARVAAWIDEVVENVNDEARLAAIAAEVADFCRAFPAPAVPLE
jgi:glycine hydroxymethyltransferase